MESTCSTANNCVATGVHLLLHGDAVPSAAVSVIGGNKIYDRTRWSIMESPLQGLAFVTSLNIDYFSKSAKSAVNCTKTVVVAMKQITMSYDIAQCFRVAVL